jgi:hypothetical protein
MARIGLLTPVKAALGRWLVDFHAQVEKDTDAVNEWGLRPVKQAIAWAPGRMVDAADEMLKTWRKNANREPAGPSTSQFLPIVLCATALDYTETPSEYGRTMPDFVEAIFPNDTLNRLVKLRAMQVDLRFQVVVAAADPMTAMSIMAQLGVWAASYTRVQATFLYEPFALTHDWPVNIVMMDRIAFPTPIAEGMSVLALDFTARAAIPIVRGPSGAEATDGQTPPGFPVSTAVTTAHPLGPPTGVTSEEWNLYASATTGPVKIVLYPLQDHTRDYT